jgi:phosphoglycerol transferase MdoB-like AlkP superfamily enzyme
MFILDDETLLKRANAAARRTSDVFHDVPLLPGAFERVVALQVESLDSEAVDTQVAGGPLMPFLRALREQAAFTPIGPVHLTGSSDADFTFLLAVSPIGVVAPYKVPVFDYSGSVVGVANRLGYRTEAFHGNRGSFFSRRNAFRQMGFDAMNFAEDLQSRFAGESYWGIPDDAILELAAERIRSGPVPSLTVLITLTTHSPYHWLIPADRELYPQPASVTEQYFNSMRYLDRCLEEFIEGLPDATLTFIYADHTSRLEYPLVPGQEPVEAATVPFIVFVKGADSKWLQPHFDAVRDRDPSLLDAAAYFHRYFSAPLTLTRDG